MKEKNIVALASRLAEEAHKLIVRELAVRGIEGIVPSHGAILMQLFSGESFMMGELAERIHRSKPTVTVLIDKLVNLGYVSKDTCAEDCRITRIRLTEQGKALKPVFREISDAINAVVYQGLAEDEAEQLERGLKKIIVNIANTVK